MVKYISSRIGQMLVTVVLVSFFTYILVDIMPKDQVYALYGPNITQEEYEAGYRALDLDKPLLVRYGMWASKVLRGDWGTSYKHHMQVWKLLAPKIAVTLYLSVLSAIVSFAVGILLGAVTAVKRGKWQDTVLTFLANLCASLPSFVVALGLLYLFCIRSQLLPTSGFTWPWVDFGKHVRQLAMPLFALSLSGVASICRQTRSSMLEVIRQDYIRTARSKGLRERVVIVGHVMRNALVPVITLLGNRLAYFIGGAMFVENVFSIPGTGSLMVQSINFMDVPVIQAFVVLSAVVISLAYLVTDILYVAVDPRISLD